jgi:paraquat-inducible protein A
MLRWIALGLHIIAIVLWFPGVFNTVMTIEVGMSGGGGLLSFITDSLSQKKALSIIGSVQELLDQKHYFLTFLVFFFALFVPFAKSTMLSLALAVPKKKIGRISLKIVRPVSKWAMADVFAVGLAIAFLTFKTNAMVGVRPGNGLYFFAAYVLISTAAAMICPIHTTATSSSHEKN